MAVSGFDRGVRDVLTPTSRRNMAGARPRHAADKTPPKPNPFRLAATPRTPEDGHSRIAEIAIHAEAGQHSAIEPVCLSFIPSFVVPKRSHGVNMRREPRLSLNSRNTVSERAASPTSRTFTPSNQ